MRVIAEIATATIIIATTIITTIIIITIIAYDVVDEHQISDHAFGRHIRFAWQLAQNLRQLILKMAAVGCYVAVKQLLFFGILFLQSDEETMICEKDRIIITINMQPIIRALNIPHFF